VRAYSRYQEIRIYDDGWHSKIACDERVNPAPKRPACHADRCLLVADELTRCGHHPTAEPDPIETSAGRAAIVP
jgi:hypothetical protein